MNVGFNFGWVCLCYNGMVIWLCCMGSYYQCSVIYVQIDLLVWCVQLLLGENFISSEFFDVVFFCGVQFFSDDWMLLDLLCYYVLVVCGIVSINVWVLVYQCGYFIYEIMVVFGVFVFDELQIVSYGGDLEVWVIEVSGEVCSFIVLFVIIV